jgi:drug/metabolite transporter (DMT)-like permease
MTEPAPPSAPRDEFRRGASLALLAALAFGITTPLIQRLGKGSGAAPTAALLYAGAALASLDGLRHGPGQEARVRRVHWPRLLLVALVGAVFAPVCLAWGLQHTDATSASLLLNFEAVFTVFLAWWLYHEAIGQRVLLALAAMATGGALLVAGYGQHAAGFGVGAIAVMLATMGWALDNTLSRPLADLSPTQVVAWKGALGGSFSLLLALASKQPFPSLGASLGLLSCGATGYGLSLRLYLYAQRSIGAARTGSIFAVAPFVGAALAALLGQGALGSWSAASALCFAFGVYLHLTEKHGHFHTHEALEHEHAHRHDDGHHDHTHSPKVVGTHSHRHSHDARGHEHEHGDDIHHRHEHS